MIGASAVRQSTSTFLGVVFGAVVALFITLLVSNAAGASGAGIFFQTVALLSIAVTVLSLGADTALVRMISARKAVTGMNDDDGLRYLIRIAIAPVACVGVLVGVALGLFAEPLADRLGLGEDGAGMLQVAAGFVGCGALLAVVLGGLRGLGRIGTFTIIQNVLVPLLRLGAVCVVLLIGLNVGLLTLAWMMPVVVMLIAGTVVLRRLVRRQPAASAPRRPHRPPPDEAAAPAPGIPSPRQFWSFAGARGVSSAIEILLEWIDVLAVAFFLGPAAAGVYGVVTRCVRVGQMVEHTARIVSSPLISAGLAVGDTERVRAIFVTASRALVLLAWPFYLLLLIHGAAVLTLFGPDFIEGAGALAVISTAMLFSTAAGGVQSMLLMGGKSRWQLINKSVALVVAVALNATLVPAWGIVGAATAWASAVLVDCALASVEVGRSMKVRVDFHRIALPAVIALIAVGGPLTGVRIVLGTSVEALIIGLVLAGLCYVAALACFRRRLRLDRGSFRGSVDTDPYKTVPV